MDDKHETPLRILQWHSADVDANLPGLNALLIDVVEGGSSVGFIPPIIDATAQDYWHEVRDDLQTGNRLLWVAVQDSAGGQRIAGSVQLALATKQNGIHRAEVQKLIVHSDFRRRGIGRKLMHTLEAAAQEHKRSLLVLDTEEGSGAVLFYESLGYTQAGIIPNFALTTDSALIATVLFYKLLNNADE